VIPSLLSQPALSNEKPTDLFAYLSLENTKEQNSMPKPLRGQIRKCNLTASRLIGGLILKEVQFGGAVTTSFCLCIKLLYFQISGPIENCFDLVK
jgi:NET1-associated nuclear protein 1 (U3 small nucleolar RNA-associated protein 17)